MDAESYTFSEVVGFEPFTLEVMVSEGRMEVILNNAESIVFDDVNIQRWSIFEKYFMTTDSDPYSRMKYFEL